MVTRRLDLDEEPRSVDSLKVPTCVTAKTPLMPASAPHMTLALPPEPPVPDRVKLNTLDPDPLLLAPTVSEASPILMLVMLPPPVTPITALQVSSLLLAVALF